MVSPSPLSYRYFLTPQRLIREVKVILGNSRKKRSKNHFVSLLVSGVLLGAGVGAPTQIFFAQSALAVKPTINAPASATSGCRNLVVRGSTNITSFKYSYNQDGTYVTIASAVSDGYLSYSMPTASWYDVYFRPWVIGVNSGGEESDPTQITLSSGECGPFIHPTNGAMEFGNYANFKSFTPAASL